LCLSYESIARDLPLEIKQQSLSSEDIITKQLYKDYSICKRQLFESIVSLNPGYNKLILFKKTQKLLDRFLFLYFAEDKSLIPANSVQGTVDKWKKHNTDPMNDYQSLYSRFVKYFKLLDVGYKDATIEIYAYNGGLFAEDEILNHIRIDDTILSQNIQKLAKYDYDTDVDVNILGHIFENSLNEIEEVTNEITTGVKTTSRRKQDGVFYTPRYITQYIVENTVGRLCEEKKTELGIGEELFEYKSAPKKKLALKVFDNYREWLLHITIVDPACGSGAFLNTALDFLIAEHAWIDNQQEKITGLKGH
jgi:type I restriction-modification system DNA methylase subunit